jgi:hypothetical protein
MCRISLSAFNSSSLTLQRRHVGRPLRRRAVGLPHRMQGFGGMDFRAIFSLTTIKSTRSFVILGRRVALSGARTPTSLKIASAATRRQTLDRSASSSGHFCRYRMSASHSPSRAGCSRGRGLALDQFFKASSSLKPRTAHAAATPKSKRAIGGPNSKIGSESRSLDFSPP